MKQLLTLILSAASTLLLSCGSNATLSEQTSTKIVDSLPDNARRLIEAYPEQIAGYENNEIVFHSGTRLTFNDGIKRTIEQMHIEQDIKDIFFQEYDTTRFPPEYGYDPGRYRSAALFDEIYGATSDQVIDSLVVVNWCPRLGGTPVVFTKIAGAADALRRVSNDLEKHPELAPWVEGAQTFNYRTILGTNRKSPHSYGIAIDLAVPLSHYWRFSYPNATEHTELVYQNTFSLKVVEIFERHGFIWGGRWYHFDTMHFEYRPEMFTTPQNNSSEQTSTTEALSPETIS